jgi:hypothetical protein
MYACESECERRLLCYEEKRGRETGGNGLVLFALCPACLGWIQWRHDNDCYQIGRMRENLPYLTSPVMGYGNRQTNSVIGCWSLLAWNLLRYLHVITPSSEEQVIG